MPHTNKELVDRRYPKASKDEKKKILASMKPEADKPEGKSSD